MKVHKFGMHLFFVIRVIFLTFYNNQECIFYFASPISMQEMKSLSVFS
jgi:hypothetical protein